MLFNKNEVCKNWYNQSCILPECTNEMLLWYTKFPCSAVEHSYFTCEWGSICWRRCLQKFIEWSWFPQNSVHWKSHFTYGYKWISACTLHSYGLILVELGVSHLNIRLVSIYEFHESWYMEAIFLLQVSVKLELHIHHQTERCVACDALGQACVLCHAVHNLQPSYWVKNYVVFVPQNIISWFWMPNSWLFCHKLMGHGNRRCDVCTVA
jgi:hypothetical protein